MGVFTPQEDVIRDKLETLRKMKGLLSIMIIVFGLISAYTFFQLSRNEIIAIIFFAFISVWYVIPLFGRRLRDYPIIKIFLVALVWAAIATFIPLYKSDIELTKRIAIFIEKYFFIFALVIPFDIRDIEFDCSLKVPTLPNKFGKDKAIVFASIALIISISIVLVFIKNRIYTEKQGVAVLFGYLLAMVLVILSKNNKSDYYFTGIIDGLPIIGLLLVLFSLFI